ncbi:lipid A deacylase LpxR family protein [Helicobacter sp. 11S02596-1]|uniref:lipid A deacylase LpxR family protein n=1 Tax=Helicobacter sp. 11S02596-1 TaxID=1476194 RepID=UPI000BA567A4|nr:lipid A deacylase LpxR family protein [Helicobacter sp. 11S02596-1]PAF44199.1 hypothetical protein BJI48_03180 [Helicobacter sp. 11S02596-1]
MKKIASGLLLCFTLSFANEICDTELIPYKRQFVNLLSENDAYADQYVDRYYTAGTSLGYTSAEYNFDCEDKDSPMAWSRYLSLLGGLNHSKMTRFSVSLTQDIYTPYSRVALPDPSDHPYAAYLRLNLGVHHRSGSVLESMVVSIGMVGPSALGYETQKLIHYLTNNPTFYGWGNQLKNEFIFNLNYQLIKKIYLWDSRWISSDILPGLDVSLGNADTHFQIGSRWRVGYNLDSDFGVDKVNSSFSGGEAYNDRFSFYVFGGISGRYQARNIFIQGNSFGSQTGLDMKYFVYDGEIGLAFLYRGMRFAYTYTHRSKTFQTQPKPHNFGSIELNIAF